MLLHARVTRFTRRQGSSDEGFTLIELLVVVLVIGVLAAIAIPAFLAQREGAYLSVLKADLHSASTAAESFGLQHGGYAGMDAAALADNGYRPSENIHLDVRVVASTYELVVQNSSLSSTRTWTYNGATGEISG